MQEYKQIKLICEKFLNIRVISNNIKTLLVLQHNKVMRVRSIKMTMLKSFSFRQYFQCTLLNRPPYSQQNLLFFSISLIKSSRYWIVCFKYERSVSKNDQTLASELNHNINNWKFQTLFLFKKCSVFIFVIEGTTFQIYLLSFLLISILYKT